MLFAVDVVLIGVTRRHATNKVELWRKALDSDGSKLIKSMKNYIACRFSGYRSS